MNLYHKFEAYGGWLHSHGTGAVQNFSEVDLYFYNKDVLPFELATCENDSDMDYERILPHILKRAKFFNRSDATIEDFTI